MFSHQTTHYLSIAVLLGLVVWGLAAIARRHRRSNHTLPQFLLYAYGRLTARVYWRADVRGRLSLAANQGAVIVCNHRSPFDPAFIQLTTDRVVHWMVAREYCQNPLISWFFSIPECIPVGRGGIDTAATKMAIRYAESGGLVGMFPEGRINTTDEVLLPGRPGAAMVALKARVPVVPCFVRDTPLAPSLYTTIFVPAKAKLIVGEPIDISAYYGRDKERSVLEELTLRFLTEIAKLAGRREFRPQLAGKKWLPEE